MSVCLLPHPPHQVTIIDCGEIKGGSKDKHKKEHKKKQGEGGRERGGGWSLMLLWW